jgi:hypothetical protein
MQSVTFSEGKEDILGLHWHLTSVHNTNIGCHQKARAGVQKQWL